MNESTISTPETTRPKNGSGFHAAEITNLYDINSVLERRTSWSLSQEATTHANEVEMYGSEVTHEQALRIAGPIPEVEVTELSDKDAEAYDRFKQARANLDETSTMSRLRNKETTDWATKKIIEEEKAHQQWVAERSKHRDEVIAAIIQRHDRLVYVESNASRARTDDYENKITASTTLFQSNEGAIGTQRASINVVESQLNQYVKARTSATNAIEQHITREKELIIALAKCQNDLDKARATLKETREDQEDRFKEEKMLKKAKDNELERWVAPLRKERIRELQIEFAEQGGVAPNVMAADLAAIRDSISSPELTTIKDEMTVCLQKQKANVRIIQESEDTIDLLRFEITTMTAEYESIPMLKKKEHNNHTKEVSLHAKDLDVYSDGVLGITDKLKQINTGGTSAIKPNEALPTEIRPVYLSMRILEETTIGGGANEDDRTVTRPIPHYAPELPLPLRESDDEPGSLDLDIERARVTEEDIQTLESFKLPDFADDLSQLPAVVFATKIGSGVMKGIVTRSKKVIFKNTEQVPSIQHN